MSDSVQDDVSVCFLGDQNDMGSITSLTKTDKNQDLSSEGVTKGVEDDVPDDDCILSERGFNKEKFRIFNKVCSDSVKDDDGFMINNKVVDLKEKNWSKGIMALQDQQSSDNVSEIATKSATATTNLVDKGINNKHMTVENTKLHYDNYEKLFQNKKDKLLESEFDNKVTKCQIKIGGCQYPPKASGENKCKIRAQSEITCSMLADKRVDCSQNSSGKNNENHSYRRSIVIETLMNILNRNQKRLENNTPMAGTVTDNMKSQTVDNKRDNKGYFYPFSSFLSVPSNETLLSNTEARKLQRPSVTPDKLNFDAGQVRKQLKCGLERVISQLEKLQQTLYILPFSTCTDNTVALTTSESLKNQIKGMMTAVTQMYHIVYNTPNTNHSFLDALYQMATQLSKSEEAILKIHDTTQEPETFLLHFQEILDSLRNGDMKVGNTVSN